jgi:hypothetical protein
MKGEIKMSAYRNVRRSSIVGALVTLALVLTVSPSIQAQSKGMHASGLFHGVKANTGFVTHSKDGGKNILTLSDDFKIPDAPAPHWQVVDSDGRVYLLQRLVVKGDKFNKSIVVPSYIKNIAKVQIWCAWAETLLGEASFDSPVD